MPGTLKKAPHNLTPLLETHYFPFFIMYFLKGQRKWGWVRARGMVSGFIFEFRFDVNDSAALDCWGLIVVVNKLWIYVTVYESLFWMIWNVRFVYSDRLMIKLFCWELFVFNIIFFSIIIILHNSRSNRVGLFNSDLIKISCKDKTEGSKDPARITYPYAFEIHKVIFIHIINHNWLFILNWPILSNSHT